MRFDVAYPRYYPTGRERTRAILIEDRWDDFGFKTQYELVIYVAGKRNDIGTVKIMKKFSKGGRTGLPENFQRLGSEFCSLGQGTDYYENLAALDEIGKEVIAALRDCATQETIRDEFEDERGFRDSLTRFDGARIALRRGNLFFGDRIEPEAIHFSYLAPNSQIRMPFRVEPEARPPANIQVIIGRNGVGKTRLLSSIAFAATVEHSERDKKGFKERYGELSFEAESANFPGFQNVVAVSFSAFDTFDLPIQAPRDGSKQRPRTVGLSTSKTVVAGNPEYTYVGLRKSPTFSSGSSSPVRLLKSIDELSAEFEEAMRVCLQGIRRMRWREIVSILGSDPQFSSYNLPDLASSDAFSDMDKAAAAARKTFDECSSGHKIVLLVVTKIVQLVSERSLVLLDEPEAYLHPPLLSSFIRAISELLRRRNAVALIATHSPVVLQEVSQDCVFVLQRSGGELHAERPKIQTFGENVGELTREVFGLEVTASGYHALIKEAAGSRSPREISAYFGNKLGSEARAIAYSIGRKDD